MQSANSLHERLIEAALAAAEDGVWNKTTLSDLALRAKVHPHEARAAFNRVDDVLDAFARRIDEQLVAALDQSELAEASPRERLLEALMARIDLLASHRSALRALGEDAQRCPTAAVRTLVRMRTSMGNVLDLTGLAGNEWQRRTRAAVLAWVWIRTCRRWLADAEDHGTDSAFASLDKDLTRIESTVRYFQES